MVKYTIENTCPKKSFASEEELRKYCETHAVPTNFGRLKEFLITKTVTEEFTLPGMEFNELVDKDLAADIIHTLADNFDKSYVDYAKTGTTPFNSYYYCSKGEAEYFKNWIIEFLKKIKPENIVECLDVHTDYKKCNNFCIHVSTLDDDAVDTYTQKYNKEHGTTYRSYELPGRHAIFSKVCGSGVLPSTIDFSTWTEDELEVYKLFVEPRDLYIQFRDDNIMVDTLSYTGHHVNHRQNNPVGLDKNRYDWCIDCIENGLYKNGKFKKFK